MTIPGDLVRAVAHGLLDVTVISCVLAVVALAVARIPGVGAGTRSRWWSAVAIVPLLAFATALLQPLVLHEGAGRAVPAPIAGTVLIDPFDVLRYGTRGTDAQLSAAPHDVALVADDSLKGAFPWLTLALALWLAIAAARFAHVLVSVVRAHRIVGRSSRAPFAPAALAGASAAVFGDVVRDAAAARVALRVHGGLDSPVAVGLTRRAVVVPARLATSLPAAELRAVVFHEIAHLRRRDDWTYLLERVACAVLWFDPVVHLAARASATWREVACDAAAARATGARTCATALWRSASLLYGGSSHRAAPALLSGVPLVGRVEALLRPPAMSSRRTVAAAAALAVLASSAGALVVVRAPAYAVNESGLTPTGSMHTRRASFAFVKLTNGRVLVAGGMIANHDFTRNAEIYDPSHGTFEPTGSLAEGRTGLSGTLLVDGRVLIAGGWTSHGVTASTEIYDPATGRFTAGAPMHSPRAGQTATILRDGTVLFAGGAVENNVSTPTAEIYDPRAHAFASVAPMPQGRVAHTATLLRDGRVLVAGGIDGSASFRSTLLYDPVARSFSPGPPMLEPRSKHSATRLGDGTVLIAGGGSDNSWRSRLEDTERYDPKTNRFVAAGTMHVHRFKIAESTVRLANGDVLIAGGGDRAEVYDVAQDRFRLVDGSMGNARNLGAAVLLNDGSVLIAGGYDSADPLPTTDSAQRYR
jgi:beta-lactamase regulating signal transducer with metallopeptidase domain